MPADRQANGPGHKRKPGKAHQRRTSQAMFEARATRMMPPMQMPRPETGGTKDGPGQVGVGAGMVGIVGDLGAGKALGAGVDGAAGTVAGGGVTGAGGAGLVTPGGVMMAGAGTVTVAGRNRNRGDGTGGKRGMHKGNGGTNERGRAGGHTTLKFRKRGAKNEKDGSRRPRLWKTSWKVPRSRTRLFTQFFRVLTPDCQSFESTCLLVRGKTVGPTNLSDQLGSKTS